MYIYTCTYTCTCTYIHVLGVFSRDYTTCPHYLMSDTIGTNYRIITRHI